MIDKNKYQEVSGGLDVDRTGPEKDQELAPGDGIEGRYVEKKTGVGKNNSNVYVLEVGTAKVGVWGSTVLDTKFANVAIGKMVAIEYLGEAQSKQGGRSYKDYWLGQGILKAGDEEADYPDKF